MKQLKVGIFAATISVLLISMGNLPAAMGGASPPTATLSLNLFCDLQAVNPNVALGSVNPNAVVQFDFDLVNNGNGDSTATITGDDWLTDPGDVVLILDSDTTYEVTANSIAQTAFNSAAQPLGTFLPGEGPEQVDLEVTVTLQDPDYQSAATLDMLVTETSCL